MNRSCPNALILRDAMAWLLAALCPLAVQAQAYRPDPAPGEEGSKNIRVVAHLPAVNAAGPYSVSDVEIEQELSRPYVYLDRTLQLSAGVTRSDLPTGFDIISIKDPARPRLIYSWRLENPELHRGGGSLAPAYLKSKGRYYFFNAFQFQQGGPDHDLGAIIWDVTGLPDTSTIKEVARLRAPDAPGGFHESFAYKHSGGQALIFAVTTARAVNIYDIDRITGGSLGPIGKIPLPATDVRGTWHDFYVGYDATSHQDRFYGGGAGGGYVFDVTDLSQPKLLASVTGVAGVSGQHTFTPTPDGRFVIAQSLPTYQYSPARVYDLKPAFDGSVKMVSRPIGAWTPSWRGSVHNFEVRWPYVFVAGQSDALQVVNFMDPTNPYTVGFYVTRPGPYLHGVGIAGYNEKRPGDRSNSMYEGAWGVDVRNTDGLIVISDEDSGFWAFKMDGFDGWNGHQWGVPNVSSVQDWDNGPEGAPKPVRVS